MRIFFHGNNHLRKACCNKKRLYMQKWREKSARSSCEVIITSFPLFNPIVQRAWPWRAWPSFLSHPYQCKSNCSFNRAMTNEVIVEENCPADHYIRRRQKSLISEKDYSQPSSTYPVYFHRRTSPPCESLYRTYVCLFIGMWQCAYLRVLLCTSGLSVYRCVCTCMSVCVFMCVCASGGVASLTPTRYQ